MAFNQVTPTRYVSMSKACDVTSSAHLCRNHLDCRLTAKTNARPACSSGRADDCMQRPPPRKQRAGEGEVGSRLRFRWQGRPRWSKCRSP